MPKQKRVLCIKNYYGMLPVTKHHTYNVLKEDKTHYEIVCDLGTNLAVSKTNFVVTNK